MGGLLTARPALTLVKVKLVKIKGRWALVLAPNGLQNVVDLVELLKLPLYFLVLQAEVFENVPDDGL